MGLGSSEAWQTPRSGRICRRLKKPELSWRDYRWAALFLLMLVACLHGQAEAPDAIQSRSNTERQEISADPPFGLPSELRHQSRSHRFWNRSNLILNGANLVAQGLDYWTTRKLLRRDYREANPVVRPFAGSDAAMAVHKFGLSFGGTGAACYFLHRTGRPRWERLATMFVLGTTAPAVGLNFRYVF